MTMETSESKEATVARWQAAATGRRAWKDARDRWLSAATELMLDLAGVGPGQRVLDVAAGTGEQTLFAARRVGPTGSVLATDLVAIGLSIAEADARAAGLSNVTFRQVDAEELDLEPDSFDAVISRHGLMLIPDLDRALSGIRRALVPGGKVVALVWSAPERNPHFSRPREVLRRWAGLPAPPPDEPGPFRLCQAEVLQRYLTVAGFREAAVHTVSAPLRLASAAEGLRFLHESGPVLSELLPHIPEANHPAALAEIEEELRQFEGADGFEVPCEFLLAVGTK